MNLTQLDSLLEDLGKRARDICGKKNADYSKDDDVHVNFKRVAELCKVLEVDVSTPRGCIQFHILHKIHRLFKLVNEGRTPENESVADNSIDIFVYKALLLGLNEEGKL